MKKIVILILGTVICSCSSSRVEKQIINDFLDKEFIRDKYVSILVEEALPKIEALEYYEKAYDQRNLYEGEIHFAPNGYPPFAWPIDSTEIGILKQKYKNDTIVYHWKNSDLFKHQLKIYPYKILRQPGGSELGGYGIYLSRPLITLDKKHAFLFYVSFANGMGSSEGKAVLMKKVNGTWVELYYYKDILYSN
jgi:hypothetical protein